MLGYIRQYIRNPIISGVICGLFAVLLAYLDDEIRGEETKKTTETYFKIFFMCFIITSFLVYMVVDVYVSKDQFYAQDFQKTLDTNLMPSKGGYTNLPQKTLNQPPDNIFNDLDKMTPGAGIAVMPHKDYKQAIHTPSTDLPALHTHHSSSRHHGKSHRHHR
jgi:hypothetical protein